MLKMESYKVEGTCVLIDDHGVTVLVLDYRSPCFWVAKLFNLNNMSGSGILKTSMLLE